MKSLDLTLLSESQLKLLAKILDACDGNLLDTAFGRVMQLSNLSKKERDANHSRRR